MTRHFDTIMHTFLFGIIIAFFAWAVALSGTVSDIPDTGSLDFIDQDPVIDEQ